MSKLKLIIQREFIAKVRNKSFIMMTFLSPLLMVGMGALVYFLMQKNDEKIKKIVYVDNSEMFSKEDFKDSKTIHYIDYTALGTEETKKKVEQGNYYGALIIPKQDSLELLAKSIEFYSKDSPGMSVISSLENKIESKIRNKKLKNFGIDLDKIKASKINTDIKMLNFSGEESSKLINGLKIGVGLIAGYLLMMFVMAALFYYISKLTASGTLKMKNALNAIGEVYLTVGAKRSKIGKVQVKVQGALRELDALTDSEEDLIQGNVIKVIEVTNNGILTVSYTHLRAHET